MKPLIGITSYEVVKERGPYATVNDHYAIAVHKAGGIPVMIPTIRSTQDAVCYAKNLDGLVLTGGNENISPLYYNESLSTEVDYINPPRDEWELCLIKAFEGLGKPILGICRGMQLLNVSRQGSLHQNVHHCKDAIGHFAGKTDMRFAVHQVDVDETSQLFDIFGESLGVNSYHYQGVKQLGLGLSATGKAKDGLTEIIEDTSKDFFVGVQWHPEAMVNDHIKMHRLFCLLVDKSKK